MRSSFVSTLSLALGVSAQSCKLQFDGRIPNNFQLAQFDTTNNIFNPKNVFGKGKDRLFPCAHLVRWVPRLTFATDLSFSKLIQLPKTAGSLVRWRGLLPRIGSRPWLADRFFFLPLQFDSAGTQPLEVTIR